MEYIESDLSTNRRITALEKKNNSVNNRLDALEETTVEGTWEPILYSGPGSIVNSNYLKICSGNYIRVGDYVWVECVIITTGAYTVLIRQIIRLIRSDAVVCKRGVRKVWCL